jgi:transposase-like protein
MSESKTPKERSLRRRWPISEKRRIVELTLREGVSLRSIAREHGVHPTSLWHWKALYRDGKLSARVPLTPHARGHASSAVFLPVTIASVVPESQVAGDCGLYGASIVQVTLPSGAMLRIETGVLDAGVLCALMAQLQR